MMQHPDRQESLYNEGWELLYESGTASCVLFQRELSIGCEDALFTIA